MSAESDLQAWLLNYSPLAALVSQRVAQGALPQGTRPPYVAWVLQTAPDRATHGQVLATTYAATVDSWAESPEGADAVADEVAAALAAENVWWSDRTNDFEPEADLYVTRLTFEWAD